jgi:hypothetical protein
VAEPTAPAPTAPATAEPASAAAAPAEPTTPEVYTARAKQIKADVVAEAGSKNAVVAVQPAIGPNGEPALLTAGAGK